MTHFVFISGELPPSQMLKLVAMKKRPGLKQMWTPQQITGLGFCPHDSGQIPKNFSKPELRANFEEFFPYSTMFVAIQFWCRAVVFNCHLHELILVRLLLSKGMGNCSI